MTITARYAGTCTICGEAITVGSQIEWDKANRVTAHEACAKAKPAEAPRAFQPTAEQEAALALFTRGESMAIEAGAGTGKTSTLLLLAQSTNRRGQYIAFNRAIVEESKMKFPGSVRCNTAHSLAARSMRGKINMERLTTSKRMKGIEIANRLGLEAFRCDTGKMVSASYLGGLALASITRFCQTADPAPTRKHVPYVDGIDAMEDGERRYGNNDALAHYMEPFLTKVWDDLMDPDGQFPFRHDHYLKAWQLSGPVIDSEFILFDEAQDANPVMLAIVEAQAVERVGSFGKKLPPAQIVWVGDSQQQIYSFTGAINALQKVSATNRTFLTQSFRFGTAVAEQANEVLAYLQAELRIVGTPTIPSVVAPEPTPGAILSRTNATAVRTVLRLQADGVKPHLVGGGAEVVRFAKAAWELQNGARTDHPELACFESWGEVQTYVEEDVQGGELSLMVKLIDDFGVPVILEALDNMVREADADVVVSTAHKAKGREWDRVQLADDFPPEAPSPEEARLLYVACTRAKLVLDIEAVDVLRSGMSPAFTGGEA